MQFYQTFGNFRILSYNDKIMSTFCIPGNVGFKHFDVFCFCFSLFGFFFGFFAIELFLLRFTDSDYPFGIFKLFFYLALLRRPLVLYRKYLTKCFVFVSIDIVYVVMTQG